MTKEQLGELIIASEDTMYHIARTLLRHDADCADAIQEAIVRAFSRIGSLKKDKYAKTWLIRILINECYSILRGKKHNVSLDEIAEVTAEEKTDYSDLYRALMSLPEKMRIAVALYYVEGYKVSEIARITGSTESMVKNRLFRARKKLRKELEDGKGRVEA